MADGKLLWEPPAERRERSHIAAMMRERGAAAHDELWRWSVADLEGFWATVWDRFGAGGAHDRVLADRSMPGAVWFPGTELNYAERLFRDKPADRVAILHASETRGLGEWTWGRLREETARIRAGLVARGVGRGDRVAAYLPNVPETIAAFLATASLGAIWSSAAPEIGAPVVRLGYLDGTGWEDGFLRDDALGFAPVPFDHPLWVLYSSGTTGLPKAIVQGQGGILLEHLKMMHLHVDAQAGDRVFWFTTTGWMMWNFLVGVLLTDASVILYDGNPAHPGPDVLWDLAERTGMTTFGTSAAFISSCMKAGVEPAAGRDLSALTAVGSTGSPLSPEGFRWVYDHVGEDTWLFSTSGGTDVCSAFVGGCPLLPVYEGGLQARSLGAAVRAFDDSGRPVVGEVGE